MTTSSETSASPQFPPLPLEATWSDKRPARVCIASYELLGPSQAGGIGAAYSALARALAGAGHDVTLLHLPDAPAGADASEEWERRFRMERIRLVRLPPPGAIFDVPACMLISRDAYNWLRRQAFDVIHFPELQGHGYYSVLAKHQGLDFASTTLCIGTHSPMAWIREQNNEPPNSPDELEMDFMERRCVALADVAVSPSQYMLRWMLGRKWVLPGACFVQQNVLDPALLAGPGSTSLESLRFPAELVFFGKLEERKGVRLFCEALDRLAQSGSSRLKVSFLGREGQVSGVAASRYIDGHSKKWPFSCRILNDLGRDDALRFLAEDPGRIAIIPSLEDNLPNTVLECVARHIPFLASAVGGIPELVDRRDIDHVTFRPDPRALAGRLELAVRDGIRAARPAVDSEANKQRWIEWHFGLASAPHAAKPGEAVTSRAAATVRVSVHLDCRDRPELFDQALGSVRSQTKRPAEVIVSGRGENAEPHSKLIESDPGFEYRVHGITSDGTPDTHIRAATGDYILFMDAEGILDKDAIATFAGVATHTGADVLTSFFAVSDLTEEAKAEHFPGDYPFLGDALIPGAFHNRFGSHVALVRRDALLRIGAPHEGRISGWAGWEFLARAVLAGCRFEVVPRPLIARRISNNAGFDFRVAYRDQVRAIRPYAAAMPVELENLPEAALTINFHYEYFYGLARERLDGERLRGQAREQLAKTRNESEASLLENEALLLKLIRQMPSRARKRMSSALEKWIEYSAARSQMPSRRVSRIPRIARQLVRGHYHLFAHGIGSALRDLSKSPKPRERGGGN